MGKKNKDKKKKGNKLLQVEEFLVCPNCRRPFFRASLLETKGAGKGHNFCGRCGFGLKGAFEGTPAGECDGKEERGSGVKCGLDTY